MMYLVSAKSVIMMFGYASHNMLLYCSVALPTHHPSHISLPPYVLLCHSSTSHGKLMKLNCHF